MKLENVPTIGRTHLTCKPVSLRTTPPMIAGNIGKPFGLWYGIGQSWADWCNGEMPEWLEAYTHAYLLDVDESRILRITTYAELIAFHNEYVRVGEIPFYALPSWEDVAAKYAGIEIAPYIGKARHTISWYYSWAVASGCIWDISAIRDIKEVV